MLSSRVIPQVRTGAITSRSGASARVDTSKRTWSLPLPVQPWATASAPCAFAARDEVLHDHGPRQRRHQRVAVLVQALAASAGMQYSSAYSSRASTTIASMAPAASARRLHDLVVLGGLADVDGQRDDLDAEVVDHPAHGDGRVEATAVGEDDALGHVRFLVAGEVGVEGCGARGPARSRELAWATCGAAGVLGDDDDQGVVAGDGAEHLGQAGAVEGGADDVGGARWRAQDDEVARVATSTTQSPNTRRRWSSGARWFAGSSGMA